MALTQGLALAGHEVQFFYTSVEGRDYMCVAATVGLSAEALACDELASQR
jgi:hypothetical protein